MSKRLDDQSATSPLKNLDEWEEDLRRRYPGESSGFRDYRAEARFSVKEFYRLNHQYQTVDFVKGKRAEYLPKQKKKMGVWEALEFLNKLVDDSDPDTELPQIEHCLQTAEAIRSDGHPRWFILTGLIHDLGKILCLFGEPQWAVTGDTFPVGCQFSDKIVFSEFFSYNPDSENPNYQSRHGMYEEQCGLDSVSMSWGHDEYMFHVVKDYLPEPGLFMIRYHSFYPAHKEGEYSYLMSDHDREMFQWVHAFNPYDLYTKSDKRPDVNRLRPFYEELIDEYFRPVLDW